MKIQAGTSIKIPIDFVPRQEGVISGSITTISDAEVEVTGLLSGSGLVSNVDDLNKINDISIYPNPAIDFLYIENLPSDCEKIQVFDIYGREMQSYDSLNGENIKIPLSDLSQSNYFIRFNSDNGVLIRKIMILK